MEIYKPLRKHYRKRVLKVIIIYGCVVLIRLSIVSWLGWVYDANTGYDFFDQSNFPVGTLNRIVLNFTKKTTPKQKVFVATAILKNRIHKGKFSFMQLAPEVGEILLIENIYPTKNYSKYKQTFFTTLNVFSLGIIKHRKPFVFRRVIAKPGDTVVYNSKQVFSVNGSSAKYFDILGIPFFDELKEIQLKQNEYFLVGNQEYGMDDKMLGPSTLEHYKGKAVLKIMPQWGIIGTNNPTE